MSQSHTPSLPLHKTGQFNFIQLWLLNHARACLAAAGELIRTPVASFLTLLVVAIALVLPTGLLVLLQNINSLSHSWHGSPSISLYLKSGISPADLQILQNKLAETPGIANVKYISPEAGLAEFQQSTHYGNVLTSLPSNPLPAVLQITPALSQQNDAALQQLFTTLSSLPNVQQTELDLDWVKRLYYIVTIGERLSYALACLFALGVMLIIGNTIRLITQNHQNEINVLRLIGAKTSFIRRPLLYRGLMIGLLGSVLAWILLYALLTWLQVPTHALAASYQSPFALQGLGVSYSLLLLLVGALLGWAGSMAAVSAFLQRPEQL